jgi:hypothetical protein
VIDDADPFAERERALDIILPKRAEDATQCRRGAERAGQHVFEDGQPVDQVELLEDHTHRTPCPAQRPFVLRRDIYAVQNHRARVRLDKPVDTPKQCGFAGTAQSEQHDDFLRLDRHVDPFKCELTAGIGFLQLGDF